MNTDLGESHSFLPDASTTNNARKMQNPDVPFYLRKRYFVCFWTGIGYMILMIFGSNISIAMVELTSNKNFITENGTIVTKTEVDWDSKMKGFILSSYSFGFMLAPMGGILAAKFGGVKIYGLGIFMGSLLTISTSYLLRSGFHFLLLARFFIGVVDSSSSSSFINIFTHWTPPHERSRLIAAAFIGFYIGIMISFTLGGFLAHNYGVDSIFIVTGGAGVVWCIIWILFVSNDPSSDAFITQKERKFFENYRNHKTEKPKLTNYVWKSILTSKPAWAIFSEYFCFAWLTSFIIKCLPLYVKDTFDVDVESVGFISSVPVFGNMMGTIFFSFIADYCRSNEIMRTGNIHRLFAAIGQLSCALFLLLITFWANYTQSLILFTVMRFFAGSAELTYQVALIDMFCEYSGIIRGIANTCFTFAAFLTPTAMGFIVTDHSRESWNLYFAFISVFNILGFVIFFIFGSGELQEWAAPKVTDEPKNNTALALNDL